MRTVYHEKTTPEDVVF